MACEIYKRLAAGEKADRDQANYLRFNGPFMGKRRTQQTIKDHDRKAAEARKAMWHHQENCEECKKDFSVT